MSGDNPNIPPDDYLIFDDAPETRGRPRTHFSDRAATGAETKRAFRQVEAQQKLENIAVLDFETDPFDVETQDRIEPFTACLYSDNFEPVIIWDENFDSFTDKVLEAIRQLPERYIIYAHNGGKFDFMFLVHKLRGRVSFKGRGIMSAKVAGHELRDSFHIIPDRLSAFHKEEFDYSKLTKPKRNKYRDEIIDYMVSDCRYLLQIVKGFVARFGFKLSIGMAAMANLKRFYKVGKLADLTDAALRPYFYGGRVECLAGKGHFVGKYKIYDVNSMYSEAMANYRHPISQNYEKRRKGGIGPNTCFLEVECQNWGALVCRSEDGLETTATKDFGTFFTTIYEYNTALELGLINNVNIVSVIDNAEFSDFSKHIVPIYEGRQETKKKIKLLENAGQMNTPEYWDTKQEDMFLKFLLNTGYGKFAQNPRRFKEWYITDPDDKAPEGFEDSGMPNFRNDQYAMWSRPAPRQSFNNVGTAASITGAARSILMRAIHNAIDPIYCDTDSIICKSLSGVEIDHAKLGAWKLEREIDEIIINGKKLYAYKYSDKDGQTAKPVVKSKGAANVTWESMVDMYNGAVVPFVNPAPTLDKTGRQIYMVRNLRATAQPMKPKRNAPMRNIANG